MRIALLLSLFVILETAGPSCGNEGLVRDSANVARLLDEIHAVLPPGWRAEFTPDVPFKVRLPWRRGATPCLAVWRAEPTLGEPVYPSMPPVSDEHEEPAYEPVQLCLQLTLTKFYSPEERQRAVEENTRRQAERERFLKTIPRAPTQPYKGSFPPAPWVLTPNTPRERELARQYALLWIRTEPCELPTHYYRTLAFILESDHFSLKDKAVASEWKTVCDAVSKIVTEYPLKSDP